MGFLQKEAPGKAETGAEQNLIDKIVLFAVLKSVKRLASLCCMGFPAIFVCVFISTPVFALRIVQEPTTTVLATRVHTHKLGVGSVSIIVDNDATTGSILRIFRTTESTFNFMHYGERVYFRASYTQSLLPNGVVRVVLTTRSETPPPSGNPPIAGRILNNGFINFGDIRYSSVLELSLTLDGNSLQIHLRVADTPPVEQTTTIGDDERALYRNAMLGVRSLQQALLADQLPANLILFNPVQSFLGLRAQQLDPHHSHCLYTGDDVNCRHSGFAYFWQREGMTYTTGFYCCAVDHRFIIGYKSLLVLRQASAVNELTSTYDIHVPNNLLVFMINAAITRLEFEQGQPFFELEDVRAEPGYSEFMAPQGSSYPDIQSLSIQDSNPSDQASATESSGATANSVQGNIAGDPSLLELTGRQMLDINLPPGVYRVAQLGQLDSLEELYSPTGTANMKVITLSIGLVVPMMQSPGAPVPGPGPGFPGGFGFQPPRMPAADSGAFFVPPYKEKKKDKPDNPFSKL